MKMMHGTVRGESAAGEAIGQEAQRDAGPK